MCLRGPEFKSRHLHYPFMVNGLSSLIVDQRYRVRVPVGGPSNGSQVVKASGLYPEDTWVQSPPVVLETNLVLVVTRLCEEQ